MLFHFDFANYFTMVRLAWNEKNPRARRTYLAVLLLWVPPQPAAVTATTTAAPDSTHRFRFTGPLPPRPPPGRGVNADRTLTPLVPRGFWGEFASLSQHLSFLVCQ